MFCRNCGAQLPEGVNFCNVCGTSVAENVQQPQTQPYVQPQPQTQGNAQPQYTAPVYNQPVYNQPVNVAAAAPKKNTLGIVALVLQVVMIIMFLTAPMVKLAGSYARNAEGVTFFELYEDTNGDETGESAKGATIAGIVCCAVGAVLMLSGVVNKKSSFAVASAVAVAIGIICIFVSVFAIINGEYGKYGLKVTFDAMGWCALSLGAASIALGLSSGKKTQ